MGDFKTIFVFISLQVYFQVFTIHYFMFCLIDFLFSFTCYRINEIIEKWLFRNNMLKKVASNIREWKFKNRKLNPTDLILIKIIINIQKNFFIESKIIKIIEQKLFVKKSVVCKICFGTSFVSFLYYKSYLIFDTILLSGLYNLYHVF